MAGEFDSWAMAVEAPAVNSGSMAITADRGWHFSGFNKTDSDIGFSSSVLILLRIVLIMIRITMMYFGSLPMGCCDFSR